MKYSLFKKCNQDKILVKKELENLFNRYNVKLNILQYKEIKDNKFYPGYIEYDWNNDIGCKKIELILNKYDWEFFFYYGKNLKQEYNNIFPIYEKLEGMN